MTKSAFFIFVNMFWHRSATYLFFFGDVAFNRKKSSLLHCSMLLAFSVNMSGGLPTLQQVLTGCAISHTAKVGDNLLGASVKI